MDNHLQKRHVFVMKFADVCAVKHIFCKGSVVYAQSRPHKNFGLNFI